MNDADAVLWLRSLVWPEHRERAALQDAALAVVRQHPPELVAGDALAMLSDAVASAPRDAALCVFHSNTLAHFPVEAQQRFMALVSELARQRPLYWLWFEAPRDPQPVLRLSDYPTGDGAEERLAFCHLHGAWVEWLTAH